MTAAVIPENEAERLAAIRRYDVLDTPPDGAFERITALAARLFDVPISIVSIVDTDRIWFKSHHGLDVEQIDREEGLCASAILQDGPWLVTDAKADPRTLANPLVAGEFGLQFYAGAPLTTRDGYNLGTLCVIDQEPREITPLEVETLADLAALVMDELELRRSARTTAELEAELRERAERVAHNLQAGLLPHELPDVAGLDLAARYHVANLEQVGGDFYDVMADGDGCAVVVGDACGKGTKAAALTGTARWTLRTIVMEPWTPASALRRLNAVLVGAYDNPERYCTIALAAVRPAASGGASLTVALGGHPPPLVIRGNGSIEHVGSVAPIVGWSGDARYTEVDTHLAPGDLIVLFTDGLLEAVAGHGATDDSPVQALLAPMAGRTATEVADRLDAALPDDELQDDAAFLVVRAGGTELPLFSVACAARDGVLRVVVTGELDIVTEPVLVDTVRKELIDSDATRVVLDVRGISFVDSSGLRAILLVREDAAARALPISVAVVDGPVTRLFEAAGVASWFTYE